MFTSRIKFPIFRLTIAMVWNNITSLYAFITYVVTSSTDFGVLVCVVRSPNPFVADPNSCTILLPSSNSNGNPLANFGLLDGTCNSTGLNFSKVSYVATLFVCSLVAYRPYCVCCCYYCKYYYKCWKCFELAMVSIQYSHTSPSKCRCSLPFRNLMSCSLLTPWLCSLNYPSCGNVICGISCDTLPSS
jgi:hypothetical protein